jgi:hypothetical protein
MEWQECYPNAVTRYVLTYKPDNGMRTLAFAAQGRNTFATPEEAGEALELWSGPEGLPKAFSPSEVASLEVRPCPCWPGHFDPCGIYFD